MEPLRVGMLFDGVTERYGLLSATANLLGALDRQRVRVTGFFLADGPARERLGPLCDEAVGLAVGSLPRTRASRLGPRGIGGMSRLAGHAAAAVAKLQRAVGETGVELVHAHYWHTFLIGGAAARLRGIRSVWHLHGGFPYVGRAAWLWDELGAGLADRVFCISRWVQATLPPACRARSALLYNGLPVGRMRDERTPGAFRRRFNVPRDAVLIGAFGLIIDRKGFDDFVEAAVRIAPRRPRIWFSLVGDAAPDNAPSAALAGQLKRRVCAAGLSERFVFAGHVPAAWREMCDFDVIALPTIPLPGDPRPDFGEGFGLVIVEAQLAGATAVATRCGAAPELIEHERTGLLVAPRDPAALADAFLRLVDDEPLRMRLARAGSAAAAERFDAERAARAAEDLYEDVCRPV